jgi:hypothetical protein
MSSFSRSSDSGSHLRDVRPPAWLPPVAPRADMGPPPALGLGARLTRLGRVLGADDTRHAVVPPGGGGPLRALAALQVARSPGTKPDVRAPPARGAAQGLAQRPAEHPAPADADVRAAARESVHAAAQRRAAPAEHVAPGPAGGRLAACLAPGLAVPVRRELAAVPGPYTLAVVAGPRLFASATSPRILAEAPGKRALLDQRALAALVGVLNLLAVLRRPLHDVDPHHLCLERGHDCPIHPECKLQRLVRSER